MGFKNTLKDDESGAIASEAAILIAVLIFPLLVGSVDFGTAMYRWKRVNDALQAQIIYISATHGLSIPSNSQQLYSSSSFSTTGVSAIEIAGTNPSTGMPSSDIVTNITYQCGCVNGTSLTLSYNFSSKQPYCPPPPDISCNNMSYWAPYVTITTQSQHKSFFSGLFGYSPLLKATATIRIN